jgi:hypothetical protein
MFPASSTVFVYVISRLTPMHNTGDNHYILTSSFPDCHCYLYFHHQHHTELRNIVLPLHICIEFWSAVGFTHTGSQYHHHKSSHYVHILMFNTSLFTLESLLLMALSLFWHRLLHNNTYQMSLNFHSHINTRTIITMFPVSSPRYLMFISSCIGSHLQVIWKEVLFCLLY